MYGINENKSPSSRRKLEVSRQNIESKKKLLASKTQEEAKCRKALQSESGDRKPEYQAIAQAAHEAVNNAEADLDEARQNYVTLSQSSSQNRLPCDENDVEARRMTVSSLELQHQGFKIIGTCQVRGECYISYFSSHPLCTEILAAHNSEYLGSQNDIVRALRWLWRSRGRHYRLLHEEEIPPRYHYESMALGKFLVSYAQANQQDTDVLFDLIRIFCE